MLSKCSKCNRIPMMVHSRYAAMVHPKSHEARTTARSMAAFRAFMKNNKTNSPRHDKP